MAGQHWMPREPKSLWREYLTREEAAEVEAIDAEMAQIKARSAALSARRYPIQNRAIQRAKHAARVDG